MAPRRYRLELSQASQTWRARLLLLASPDLLPLPDAPVLEWAEFDSPLALLEWLERDLPLDVGFTGLR